MGITAPIGVASWGQPATGDQANAVVSGTFTAIGPGKAFAFRGPMDIVFGAQYVTALTTTAGSLAATAAAAGNLAVGNAINSVNVPRGTTIGALAGTAITLALPIVSLQGVVDLGIPAIRGLAQTTGLLNAPVTGPGIPAGTTVTAIRVAADPTNNILGVVQLSAQPTSAQNDIYGKQNYYDFQLQASAITTTGADAAAIFTGASITYTGTIQIERSFDGCATFWPANIGGGGTIASYAAGTPVSLSFGEPERQVYYRLNCTAYTIVSGVTIAYRVSTTGAAPESLAISSVI